jgi:hypothetical protein
VNRQIKNGGGNTPRRGTIFETIAKPIGLGVVVIGIWALVCAARVTFATISMVFEIFSSNAPSGLLFNVILSGLSGVFAAAAIAVVRAWPRKPGKLEESFVSALFNKGLVNSNGDFLKKAFVYGIIGFLAGGICGAGGMTNFPQFFSDSTAQIFRNASAFPILVFAGGGFGGPDGGGFLALLFLIFVILIISFILGLLAGLIVHLSIAAIAGSVTKGAVKGTITKMLEEKTADEENHDPHPFLSGLKRGAWTGLVAGIMQAAFTAWGIVHFSH